jgi:ribosome-binding protein aMBF1 (putative translation factor)
MDMLSFDSVEYPYLPIDSLPIGGGLAREHTRTIPGMQEVQKRLGKRVASLRRKKGFSQEEFAHECGFHRSYMGAVERGEKNITIAMIAKIAKALNMTLTELFKSV